MSEQEQQALEALLAAHPGKPVSLTRRDPNEAGPLLVHVGDETFELPSG